MPEIVDHDQQRERIRRVFWNEDHFEVPTQDERKLFAAEAKTFTTDVVFESDQRSSLTTGDMTGRVLRSLTEMQGSNAWSAAFVPCSESVPEQVPIVKKGDVCNRGDRT